MAYRKSVQRPRRWDVPFDPEMGTENVEALLSIPPFSRMDPARFSKAAPLAEILRNDTRILEYAPGDLVVREGDYGNSAFLVLQGGLRASITPLPRSLLGRSQPQNGGWLATLRHLWQGTTYPEVRRIGESTAAGLGTRGSGSDTRVFLQDIPGVLDEFQTSTLAPGDLFGEVSALSRTPRMATIFAETPTRLLEIRWQGLRDMMRRDHGLQNHIHARYRQTSLRAHLRETPLFRHLPEESVEAIAEAAEFTTYGNFEWQAEYRKLRDEDVQTQLAAEPIIAQEGDYVDGLLLIRAGFARLSRKYGHGHRTLAYLGKGQMYGFHEAVTNWSEDAQLPLQWTLRAVGYVDILRVPTPTLETHIFPTLSASVVQQSTATARERRLATRGQTARRGNAALGAPPDLDAGLLEFVLDHRLMNGTQTMVINTDRCTRCDDCVRACSDTHGHNPRFVRHGPRHGNLMVTNACMHCVDPVCMIGCPTGAIGRDELTGNVVINDPTCVGCSTCANSCPYHNIRMVETRAEDGAFYIDEDSSQPIVKATKCDLCVDQWGGPACQRACPHNALIRLDVSDVTKLADWVTSQ